MRFFYTIMHSGSAASERLMSLVNDDAGSQYEHIDNSMMFV
ncbi:protein of unassigned function [Methylobacterium oryzae CBMB20]|uniref:Protein of unassigned function n=1 Tax=Methylobacterium oryzae CBMB20 TaxID=693986 RepID=A0A089Q826_9HYPH|nr:protein of unassigned function [Methylobacterium oryzae CBMB20]